jgi:hypothetical protein
MHLTSLSIASQPPRTATGIVQHFGGPIYTAMDSNSEDYGSTEERNMSAEPWTPGDADPGRAVDVDIEVEESCPPFDQVG